MSRINLIVLIAFVALLGAVFFFGQDTVARIQRGWQSAFSPVIAGANKVEETVTGLGKDTLSAPVLRDKLAEAELERDRLRLEVLRMDELAEENSALRRALNYVEKSPLQLVPARVISRKPSNWYNTLVIDKGLSSKIAPDCPVIVPVDDDAALVGKVSEVVGKDSAVIILVSDEVCQVSARIEGTTEQGILRGQRGALRVMPDLKLGYLSNDAAVPEGRLVITSGAGGLFPENLLLGKVKKFEAGAITGEATVTPVVSFDVLTNVFVILPELAEGKTLPGTESTAIQDGNETSAVERAKPLAP